MFDVTTVGTILVVVNVLPFAYLLFAAGQILRFGPNYLIVAQGSATQTGRATGSADNSISAADNSAPRRVQRRLSLTQEVVEQAVVHEQLVVFERRHEEQHAASLAAIRAREARADARVQERLAERKKARLARGTVVMPVVSVSARDESGQEEREGREGRETQGEQQEQQEEQEEQEEEEEEEEEEEAAVAPEATAKASDQALVERARQAMRDNVTAVPKRVHKLFARGPVSRKVMGKLVTRVFAGDPNSPSERQVGVVLDSIMGAVGGESGAEASVVTREAFMRWALPVQTSAETPALPQAHEAETQQPDTKKRKRKRKKKKKKKVTTMTTTTKKKKKKVVKTIKKKKKAVSKPPRTTEA